jgi:hypothetical protein
LPPPPQPFGWTDSTGNVDKNINAFLHNPVNPNEIIYVVNGDLFGFNKMYSIHVPTKQIKYLATLGEYLPQMNNYGWLVFSDVDNNIFKIKANGDSLMQLTSQKISHDPKWDFTGKNIYYYQEAYFNVPSQLVKINSSGGLLAALPIDMAYHASFKKSDKVIFQKTLDKSVTLILRDMVKYNEKNLITGPFEIKGPVFFDNITVDQTDENFYWSNAGGIFRCNLATLAIDTILKNCPNFIYDNPIISSNQNELTYSWHIIRPVSQFILYHEYKAMEMNLVTKEITEVKVFP